MTPDPRTEELCRLGEDLRKNQQEMELAIAKLAALYEEQQELEKEIQEIEDAR